MKKFIHAVWEVAEVFIIAFIAVAAIKYFLIQPFIVNGASMEPSFYDGDYLLVDEISYRFSDPQRGDVVVFHSPDDSSIYYIKRIIGLPGETLQIQGNDIDVYKDTEKLLTLNEVYIPERIQAQWSADMEITLGEEEYFVMGDNRVNSRDSRSWGPLHEESIIGLVKVRLWPFSHVTFFNTPSYAY